MAKAIAHVKEPSPEWSHIITHRKYNSTMASRAFLNEHVADKLLAAHTSLFSLTSSLSSLVEQLGAGEARKDTREEADGALDHGQATMTLIAAVSMVEGPKGGDASDKAKRLLREKATPESLRARLRENVEVD